MDQDVWVPPDGRGEVGVEGHVQSVVVVVVLLVHTRAEVPTRDYCYEIIACATDMLKNNLFLNFYMDTLQREGLRSIVLKKVSKIKN